MRRRARQWTAILAAAIALGCVGAFGLEPVSDFSPWPASGLVALGITATICGFLLTFNTDRSAWAMVAAAALATLILAGIWAYITWKLLGQFAQHISILEILVSDPVFYFGILRGFILLVFSVPLGLIGVKIGSVLITEDGRQQQQTHSR